MTVEEMSDLFDVLLQVHTRTIDVNQIDPLAFDEYEKSVCLTDVQERFVVSCYNGKNNAGYQFEVTEEDRRLLDVLVNTDEITEQCDDDGLVKLIPESKFYKLPDELMFITYEQCTLSSDDSCINGSTASVFPVTQDDFWKTYKNPFRSHSDRRVLRLDAHGNIVELVSKNDISKYTVRYVRKPKPIVLTDLPDGLQINGFDKVQPCELPEQVHRRIVEAAVNMAIQRRSMNTSNK